LAVDGADVHRAGLAVGARVVVGVQRRDYHRVAAAITGERRDQARIDTPGE
jgi:hypothetical protein